MSAKPNRPGQFREEDLDFLKEDGHMVHGLPAKTWALMRPEPTFPPCKKPSPSLPIDDVVADLMDRRRRPKISGAEDRSSPCPFRVARDGVTGAAVSAYLAYGFPDLAAKVGDAAAEVRDDLNCGLDALKRLTEHFSRLTAAGRNLDLRGAVTGRAARADRSLAERRASSLAEALPELRKTITALESVSFNIKDRVDDLDPQRHAHLQWRAAFIERLGNTWVALTGENPKLGAASPFHEFVRAAFISIGGDEDVPWEHGIREVIKTVAKRPEWDRFDRYTRGLLPPGVDPDTPEARRAIACRMAESFLMTLAAAAGDAASGDASAAAFLAETMTIRAAAERAVLEPFLEQMKRGEWQFSPDDVSNLLAARAEDRKKVGWD